MLGTITWAKMIRKNTRRLGRNTRARLIMIWWPKIEGSTKCRLISMIFSILSLTKKSNRMMISSPLRKRSGTSSQHDMITLRLGGLKESPKKAVWSMMAQCSNYRLLSSTTPTNNLWRTLRVQSLCPKRILMISFRVIRCNWRHFGLLMIWKLSWRTIRWLFMKKSR